MTNNDLPDKLNADELDRYLTGSASIEETERVRRFLESHPEHTRRLDALLSPDSQPDTADPDRGWALIRARLRDAGTLPDLPPLSPRWERRPKVKIPTHRSSRLWWGLPVAIAAAALLWLRPGAKTSVTPEPKSAMHVLTTGNGERATIDLADGTRVTLAPASRLRVPESFGTTKRDVYLEGHAKFDVRHAPTPFIVHASDVEVRDLGTVFVVKGYINEKLQVGVAEGNVQLSSKDSASSPQLSPGDLATVDADGHASVQHGVPIDRFLGWTSGQVEFHDQPLREVTGELNRWFPITVVVSDSVLLARRITTTFHGSRQLRETIAAMAAALGADARWRGDTVALVRSGR
jgi:transmembrane sensor